jgi:hypothetical protein
MHYIIYVFAERNAEYIHDHHVVLDVGVGSLRCLRKVQTTQQLNQFGRTLKDELRGALDVARYQVKLSSLGRWNALPIAVLSVTGLFEAGKAFWITIVVILFFIILNYAAGWEVNVYKRRLTELEALKQKLEGE